MNQKTHENNFGIIASSVDIPDSGNSFSDFLRKIEELPVKEIEIEAAYIDQIKEFRSIHNQVVTAMINYPLGGYSVEYLLESIRWAAGNEIDIICTNLPLCFLRSNETGKLSSFIKEISRACENKKLRISIESGSLSRDEISTCCEMICNAGIFNLKSSSGFSGRTSSETIHFIKNNFPEILLTVDNRLSGNSIEIDDLFRLGVNYICVNEPWLYHF